jgi:hypothetical protein
MEFCYISPPKTPITQLVTAAAATQLHMRQTHSPPPPPLWTRTLFLIQSLLQFCQHLYYHSRSQYKTSDLICLNNINRYICNSVFRYLCFPRSYGIKLLFECYSFCMLKYLIILSSFCIDNYNQCSLFFSSLHVLLNINWDGISESLRYIIFL